MIVVGNMLPMDMVMIYVYSLLSQNEKMFTDKVGYFLPPSNQTCPNCLKHGLSAIAAFYPFRDSDNSSIYICDDCYDQLHKQVRYSIHQCAFLMPVRPMDTIVPHAFSLKLIGMKNLVAEISWFNANASKASAQEQSEWNMTPEFRKMQHVIENVKTIKSNYEKEFFKYSDAVQQHSCCVTMQNNLDQQFDLLHTLYTEHKSILTTYSDFKIHPKRHLCSIPIVLIE